MNTARPFPPPPGDSSSQHWDLLQFTAHLSTALFQYLQRFRHQHQMLNTSRVSKAITHSFQAEIRQIMSMKSHFRQWEILDALLLRLVRQLGAQQQRSKSRTSLPDKSRLRQGNSSSRPHCVSDQISACGRRWEGGQEAW